MDKDSQSHVARKQGMPTLPVPPKVTAGVKKVGGTNWKGGRREKGGWHRLERWVAPIGERKQIGDGESIGVVRGGSASGNRGGPCFSRL